MTGESESAMQSKKSLNYKVVRLAAIGTLFALSQYITLPVMALYLNQFFHISIPMVGILLGVPMIISSIFGRFASVVARRLGNVNTLSAALILYAFDYLGYTLFKHPDIIYLISLSIVAGLSRILWQPVFKGIYAQVATESSNADTIFRINYLTIVTGASVGPVLVILLGGFQPVICIYSTSFLYIFISILVLFNRNFFKSFELGTNILNIDETQSDVQNKRELSITLYLYIFGGFLIYCVFSEFESVFPLALKFVTYRPASLFSELLILNSICGFVFQSLMIFSKRKPRDSQGLFIGNLAFCIAFLTFAISLRIHIILVVGTIIFTIGEIFALPGSDIAINRLAPNGQKAAFFGLAEFRILGFTVGPALFGYLLYQFGYVEMFLFSIPFIVLASLSYWYGYRILKRYLRTDRTDLSQSIITER